MADSARDARNNGHADAEIARLRQELIETTDHYRGEVECLCEQIGRLQAQLTAAKGKVMRLRAVVEVSDQIVHGWKPVWPLDRVVCLLRRAFSALRPGDLGESEEGE